MAQDRSAPEQDDRKAAVSDLMKARRAVRFAKAENETRAARADVQAAKERLGERGPVWWEGDAQDETGRAPWNSSYAEWWAAIAPDKEAS